MGEKLARQTQKGMKREFTDRKDLNVLFFARLIFRRITLCISITVATNQTSIISLPPLYFPLSPLSFPSHLTLPHTFSTPSHRKPPLPT